MEVVRALIRRKSRKLRLLGCPGTRPVRRPPHRRGLRRRSRIERGVARRGRPRAALHARRSEKGEIVVRDATCPAVHSAPAGRREGRSLHAAARRSRFRPRQESPRLEGARESNEEIGVRPHFARAGDRARHRAVPRALGGRGGERLGRAQARARDHRACGQAHARHLRRIEAGRHAGGRAARARRHLRHLHHRRGAGEARRLAARHPGRLRHRRRAPRALCKAAKTREGFKRYLDEFVCIPEKSSSPA